MDRVMTSPMKMKALKTTRDATPQRSRGLGGQPTPMHDVLHLDMVMQRVLVALPLDDLRGFLTACGAARELAWLLEDALLWEELTTQHFGGHRSVAAEAQAEQEEEGDNGFGGDGDDDDDEDDDDEEEEDDEQDDDDDEEEDQDQDVSQTNSSEEVSEVGREEQSSEVATGEPVAGAAATAPADDTPAATSPTTNTSLPNVDLPAWLKTERACDAARAFMVSLLEWTQFRDRVNIVRGDIGAIQDIQGHAIDALAFPGNNMMSNPFNGAASAVFRRAGNALSAHTNGLHMSLRAGQCHVTPGFDSGARVLIHCYGPYNSHPRLYETLGKTYRNVLRKAKQENAECLALTSISTGNFGVPIPEASRTAMRAIQQFLRAHHDWQGRVGVVCYEADVFEAFRAERQCVLDAFNAPHV